MTADTRNLTLEVIVVPVSDVDRSKDFYTGQLGFNADFDTTASDEMRFVQLTPPGSGCSIMIGTGITTMDPGSLEGLQLVTSDLDATRADFVDRGVDVSEVEIVGPAGMDGSKFIRFADPDGNRWGVQELRARA